MGRQRSAVDGKAKIRQQNNYPTNAQRSQVDFSRLTPEQAASTPLPETPKKDVWAVMILPKTVHQHQREKEELNR